MGEGGHKNLGKGRLKKEKSGRGGGCVHFSGQLYCWGHLNSLSCLHFWGCLPFLGRLHSVRRPRKKLPHGGMAESNLEAFSMKRRFYPLSSSINHCLPPKVVFSVFLFRLSSTKSCLPLKVVVHQRSSSIKGHLSSRVFFQQWSASIKDCLPSEVVFYQSSSSI